MADLPAIFAIRFLDDGRFEVVGPDGDPRRPPWRRHAIIDPARPRLLRARLAPSRTAARSGVRASEGCRVVWLGGYSRRRIGSGWNRMLCSTGAWWTYLPFGWRRRSSTGLPPRRQKMGAFQRPQQRAIR